MASSFAPLYTQPSPPSTKKLKFQDERLRGCHRPTAWRADQRWCRPQHGGVSSRLPLHHTHHRCADTRGYPPFAFPTAGTHFAREKTQMSTPKRLASRRHPLACRAGKAYSGGLGFFTLTATQRHGLHVECKCRQPCARLRRGSCRHTNRPSVMPTLTRGAHAEKLGTAFYPAKTDVSGNIEVGSFQRRGPSQFEARS